MFMGAWIDDAAFNIYSSKSGWSAKYPIAFAWQEWSMSSAVGSISGFHPKGFE